MSKKGGYKIVSLGGLDLTGEDLALEGLYNALKISYGKPILLSGIVIDGEKMKDIYVTANEGADEINIKHVYGYNLTINDENAITVVEDNEDVPLPVPAPEDDGKLIGVNVQGKYVLKTNPLGEATVSDNGKVLEVIDGDWAIGGKKVNVIDAPTSTTLTNELISKFTGGVFVNGNLLSKFNPVFFPCFPGAGELKKGVFMGGWSSSCDIGHYEINSSKVLSIQKINISINYDGTLKINGKTFPEYPNDDANTYSLKLVAGVLTWVQDA